MKLNKSYLLGIAALGLVACNKEDNAPEVNGNTYARMSVGLSQMRAVDQADEVGRTEESKVTSIDVIATAGNQTFAEGTADQDGKFWFVTDHYNVAPWKTTSGAQDLAVVLNKPAALSLVIGNYATETYAGANLKDGIAALATDNSFFMTSKAVNKTITDGITKDQAKTGTAEAQNVFKFDVERVVAQGKVYKDTGLKSETTDGKGNIALDKITYAAVNGGAKTYVYGNNAGDRTMTDATKLYKDFVSVINDFKAGAGEYKDLRDAGQAAGSLVRLGAVGNASNQGLYAAKPIIAAEADVKTTAGIYFMENSVKKDQFSGDNKKNGYYRLAYAKVYAEYTPKNVLQWDAANSKFKAITIAAGKTYYMGEKDHQLYDTKESAKKAAGAAANQKVFTYTNGKCAYRALWNRQLDPTGKSVLNADVRRNNIYVLAIKAFAGIGMPWDPSDPQDPNLPKPTDPDEPNPGPGEGPDDPNIEKQDTYMRVEAKILPWNMVTRKGIVLE